MRIAGLGERIAALGCTRASTRAICRRRFPKRRSCATSTRNTSATSPRSARRCIRRRSASLDEGAMPIVLGGDHSIGAGSVAAAAEWARRTRNLPIGLLWVDAHGDMNTPATSLSGNVHGMPLAALLGPEPAELSKIGDVLAEGAARAHGARRHPQPRRAREGRGPRFGRARLHDEGHRSPRHRVDRRAGREPRGQRHRRHSRLVRHRRLRSADRARRRHAGQGRAELPRGAHGDGDRRRLRAADVAGSGRGEPDAGRAQHDGAARRPSWRCRR